MKNIHCLALYFTLASIVSPPSLGLSSAVVPPTLPEPGTNAKAHPNLIKSLWNSSKRTNRFDHFTVSYQGKDLLPTIKFTSSLDDITIPIPADPSFNWAPEPISNAPRLNVIGDGLAAGYRDGGLTRHGQLTAYPVLLARQMRIGQFSTPIFDREHAMGTGRTVVYRDQKKPYWKQVSNNLAFDSRGRNTLINYSGKPVENMALPGGSLINLFYDSPDNVPVSFTDNSKNTNEERLAYQLLGRFQLERKKVYEKVLDNSPDYLIMDYGLDYLLYRTLKGRNVDLWSYIYREYRPLDAYAKLFDKQIENPVRQIIFTIPDFLQFPYFSIYSRKELAAVAPETMLTTNWKSKSATPLGQTYLLLPTDRVKKLFDGVYTYLDVDNDPNSTLYNKPVLGDEDVLDSNEIANVRTAIANENERLRQLERLHLCTVFDLHAVFNKVLAGGYVSDDGLRINPSWPDGNFFSEDGLYPSAIGQAVITNELIKFLNATYQSKLPLIPLKVFNEELMK